MSPRGASLLLTEHNTLGFLALLMPNGLLFYRYYLRGQILSVNAHE